VVTFQGKWRSSVSRDKYIIALDIGTGSTKGLLYKIGSKIGNGVLCLRSESYPTYYPGPGKVEQDPDEILESVIKVIYALVSDNGLNPADVSGIVYGGILHSFLPVDVYGKPLSKAMIWGDSRSARQSDRIRSEVDPEAVKTRTGCSLHPLYFLPRIEWLKENDLEIFKKVHRIISIKEYILSRLYGKFVVDRSVASGTGMLNMESLNWDSDLLDYAGLKRDCFSPVVETTFILNSLKKRYAQKMGLLGGTPGIVGSSDGPCAHLATAGLSDTEMSITVGTSGALRRKVNKPGVLPGLEAWCYYLTEESWLLGGVAHDAGMAMNWFFKNFIKDVSGDSASLDVINKYADRAAPGAGGLLFFPFLGGERSPMYNPTARGLLLGMSYEHRKEHFTRALMEGISYRLYTNYKMLDPHEDMELVISGGILKSKTWLQITADFFGKTLLIPEAKEASAYGAALIGLRALEIIKKADIKDFVRKSGAVEVNQSNCRLYREVYKNYRENYERFF
jgi:gluconokinase